MVWKALKYNPVGTDAYLPLAAGAKSGILSWLEDFSSFIKSRSKLNFEGAAGSSCSKKAQRA